MRMMSVHGSLQIGHDVSGAAQRSHAQTWPQGTHARDFGASKQMTHCSSASADDSLLALPLRALASDGAIASCSSVVARRSAAGALVLVLCGCAGGDGGRC